MKKGNCRVYILVMVILLLTASLSTAIAAGEISPYYVIYCQGSQYQGRHAVVPSGEALVYVNGKYVFGGFAFQCERCNAVIATQYRPKVTNYPGKYAMYSPGYKIGNGITIMHVSKTYSNTSNWTIAGYYFK